MIVKLAKTAGFCMGVRRAMEIVLTESNRRKDPMYTFGPLIHNHQVLELLESKGVEAVEDVDEIKAGTIVIRAHGIPPQTRKKIKRTSLRMIDATCPKVAKVQAIIRYNTKKGASAIIVGNESHAEVVGLLGYSETPAHVIQTVEDVSRLPDLQDVFVVAQTTQNEKKYMEIIEALQKRFLSINVYQTICNATFERQQEVRSFVDQIDALVVVGGFHSGNTQRLVQVAREMGLTAFHVETENDLDMENLSGMKVIGVTAGASTPNWMIKNVVSKIEAIRGKGESALPVWFKRIFRFVLGNSLGVSLGAFCFAYAAAILSEREPDNLFPFLAFLYIYAMHVLNRFLDKGASAYNDPERARFLREHQALLILTGVAAIAIGLLFAYFIGMKTFLVLSGLSLLGIMYSVPLLPEKVRHKTAYIKIKDIPGSRSLSESLAWVAIICLLPLLTMAQIHWPAVILSVFFVFGMSYARATLTDIFEVQGDLIVGMETLPITIGERKTIILLKLLLLAIGIMLSVCSPLGYTTAFSYVMLIPVAGLFLCLTAYEKRWIQAGIMLETLVELNFLLAGLLALIWWAAK